MCHRILSLFILLFSVLPMVAQETIVNVGKWSVIVNETSGKATIKNDEVVIVADNEAEWGLNDEKTNYSALSNITITQADIDDAFGTGKRLSVTGVTAHDPVVSVTHTYYIYSNRDYILTDVVLRGNSELEINYIAPIRSSVSSQILDAGTNLHLYVPFDNDEWVRYKTTKFGTAHPISYEVTALFNNDTRCGLVTGSIEHDTWKTGIEAATQSENKLTSLRVFNGVASMEGTRDKDPHGAVKAVKISSSKVMIGYFPDWRVGMETYGDLCAMVHPKLPFAGAKPFGWNSWGVIQENITRDQAVEVAKFFADSLQPVGFFAEDSVVYIGLDSFWDNFSMRDHMAFVRKCKENNQKAGIYWTPFVDWGNYANGQLPDGSTHSDAWLRDSSGNPLKRTGATAFDPTHPGTQARIKKQLEQFIEWGYEFIKLDFMIHGILEGVHYDKNIHTGVQAYNAGMQYIKEIIGDKMFINLSIAPLFPAHYAHSRRIACDAYASLSNSEYTLNSTAYGWWLDHCYSYNDADNVVLKDERIGANRVRFTSSCITGIVILGDEFTSGGDAGAKERIVEIAANNEVVQMAYRTKAFRPVDAVVGDDAPNLFMYAVGDTTYLAGLNYLGQRHKFNFDFERLGLTAGTEYVVRELWTGDEIIASESYEEFIPRSDAAIYKIYPKPANHNVEALHGDTTRCYYDAYIGEVRVKGCNLLQRSTIYNAAGMCVAAINGEHDAIDVNSLSAGIYILQTLDTQGNTITLKFVK